MIFWLGILSIVIAVFLSFSKLLSGFILSILSAIAFRLEKKRELFIFSTIIAFIILVKMLSNAIIPIIISILITLIYLPIVEHLQKYKIPRFISAIFFISLTFGIFVILGYFLINVLIAEFQKVLNNIQNFYNYIPQNIRDEILNQLKGNLDKLPNIINAISSTISIPFYLIIGIILSFYLILDYRSILNLLSKKFDISGLEYVISILGRYIRAQILTATIVGFMVYILCLVLSLKYAHLIGFIAGVFNLIPNIGFLFTIILSFLITLASSNNLISDLIKLIIVFTIDQIIETTILTPRIMGQTFKIEPTLIILGLTIFTALMGVWGFLIAVPSVVILRSFLFENK
jgi:predicted PurR-regulated permease PerM